MLKDMQEFLSVSHVAQLIKNVLEPHFSNIRIKGELTGVKTAASGHIYMSLKDSNAIIDAICWRSTKIPFPLNDGLEIIATGKLTTYPLRSKYQLIIQSLEIAGIGSLLQQLEILKIKLRNEGLFDSSYKKKLPIFPQKIGIITSQTGSVIQDMLHRLADRFPCQVILWPCTVQGETAAKEIIHAIQGFQSFPIDLIIIARGGGSLEDLWCFNDEKIVRAVFSSVIPIISAIGHETDTTLIDYVADLRAPTPTAAIEFSVPVLADIREKIQTLKKRISYLAIYSINHYIKRISLLRSAIKQPDMLLLQKTQQLDWLAERLKNLQTSYLEKKSNELKILMIHSPDLSPYYITLQHLNIRLENTSLKKILQRGFTIATYKGKPITYLKNIKYPFDLQFQDGVLQNLKPVPDP